MSTETFWLFVFLFVTGSPLAESYESCRCLASDHRCWPSPRSWEGFNSSINGRLITVLPPAAACYRPHFNLKSCQIAQRKWSDMFWRTDQPGAYQDNCWQSQGNQHCQVIKQRPQNYSSMICSQGLVPVLAVNVSQASHVQSAVRFAARHNLRLVIKNTGHDYVGRSRAAGSFALWMHNLKAMDFHQSFVPEGCSRTSAEEIDHAAVTVGAGVQWEELYQAVFERNSVIVGGGCSSVGAAGGYPQGGGHSLISPLHGLAADNILQYEVVTADGKFLVANSCQNRDLFWALRGGGGGTFGVVISATHKIHPPIRSLVSSGHVFTAKNRTAFVNLISFLAEMSVRLSDAGWSGYSLLSSRSVTVGYVLFNANESIAEKSFDPLVSYARKQPGVEVQGGFASFRSFQEWHLRTQCEGNSNCYDIKDSFSMDVVVSIASRLIPREAMEKSPEMISRALVSAAEALDNSLNSVVLSLVGGGRVAAVKEDNAVNPAWREALWHVVLSSSLSENATAEDEAAAAETISDANALVIRATPGSGTYMNEADFNEPNWQQSFFGSNYQRLLAVKRKHDPLGLFVCHHCVGSEDWSSDLNCRSKKQDSEKYSAVL